VDDLIAFLRARLDEREQIARACTPGPWRWGDWSATFGTHEKFRRTLESAPRKEPFPAIARRGEGAVRVLPHLEDPIEYATDDEPFEANAQHIIDNNPARVLAEVDAQQRIIDMWDPNVLAGSYFDALAEVLCLLALPYAGHPDYREEWRP